MVAQQANGETRTYTEYIEELDFQKYWLVLKRRWIPAFAVFSTTVALSVFAALSEESVYKAEGRVLFRSDRTTSLTGLGDDRGRVEILAADPLDTQAELIRSLPLMQATVDALGLTTSSGRPLNPRALLGKVSAQPVGGTDVLRISVESEDPEEAAAIVNQVIESYREQNIESNREEAAAARQFIEEQLPTTEAEVLRVEGALREFKETNDIISLDQEASNAVSVLAGLDQDIGNIQAQLADISAQLGQLRGQLGVNVSEGIALSSLNQSEGVQEALSQLQQVQTQLSNERARYREGHPAIERLELQQAEIEALLSDRIQEVLGQELTVPVDSLNVGRLQLGELRQNLIAELTSLEIERIGLSNRMSQLMEARANYLERANDLPELEKQQRELDRQLEAAQTTYETLLSQLQETRVIENQTVGNVRVVSLAQIPNSPAGPDRRMYLVAGGFMGVLLAIATAFLLDLLDSSVKTVKEVKELYGYTVLGVIPLVKGAGRSEAEAADDHPYPRLLVNQPAHVGVREAYQMMQANLKFLQSDTELKTVMITSAVPGEGKSEIAANLAAALAQVGRRVLLIDADMRYPRQHHALKVLNRVGLSHVITGQARVKSAIQTVMQNLDVLTAGAVPPNPVALLDSKRMESLLQSLAQVYEVVIIDAPPLVGYADAPILGKMADGTLLVARPGVVDYAQGRIAKDVLAQSQQWVLGMVANGVNPANEPDGHFYYLRQETTESVEEDQEPVLMPVGKAG
ncbi:MAG: polysaccharide biosynthesis tyrosine autokinase [Leptolyngbya sp. SIO1E4]|nr:polysaccharide biosynthesis tyrosine autokinase [Leptolyngbya sp. SIO1E4]